MDVREKLNAIKATLPPQCRLIAVSKNHPVATVMEAYAAGQRIFGENKVQEMVPKWEAMPKDIEWHMIGHLQRNKVKYIAPFVQLIHSIDNVDLLREVEKQGAKVNRTIECLLQVYIAKEETKFGFSEDEVMTFLSAGTLSTMPHVKIVGLMGMATFTDNQEQIRSEFKILRSLFDRIKNGNYTDVEMKELSMGMSSDYEIAIEEGSTLIRIGTAIFGNRNYTTS